jgi:hypothetical protein
LRQSKRGVDPEPDPAGAAFDAAVGQEAFGLLDHAGDQGHRGR